jgi:hypothetical protein
LLKLIRSFSFTVFVVVLSGFLHSHVVAQVALPPPQQPVTSGSGQDPKRDLPPSPVPSRNFVSLEGRFSISLPEQSHGLQALTFKTPFGVARGDAYLWRLNAASFVIGYADAAQPVDTPEATKQFFDGLREGLKKLASENSGTVAADKPIELNKHKGIEQRVDLFTGFMIQRTYIVSRRLYQTVLIVRTEQRDYEAVARTMFDSFKLLSDADVSEGLAREATKAEPSPLPQQPVAQRAGTDATDVGLQGKVKTVLEESQDLSGTWSVQTRKRDSFGNYNEVGNLTRRESYDYKGNLYDITVYGYVDGSRVSKFKTITREYNPPPMVSVAPGSAKKSDPRFTYKFEFKYDEKKRLTEKTYFHSNGERYLRYVSKYTGNQLESLVYSQDGSLNQRSVSLLDSKGNEVERTSFDPRDGSRGSKYSYVYEFDSNGNWTKKTTSKVSTKDGREQAEAEYVGFRTITYY